MIHLGRDPQWVSLSGTVHFPDALCAMYTSLMSTSVSAFERDFAAQLSARSFSVEHVIAQPKGLTNARLMCFANASMQLLLASPFFLSFARFMNRQRRLFSPAQRRATPAWGAVSAFLSDFRFTDSATSDGATPSLRALSLAKPSLPTDLSVFDSVFGMFSSRRRPLQQEDAIQFLMYFLNLLHEEVLALMRLGAAPADGSAAPRVGGAGRNSAPLRETQGEQSPLSDVFVTMVHSHTLQNGRTRTITKESHLVVPLPIEGVKTLEEAIAAFAAEEKITSDISKKTSFVSFPKSLIFGLKPFAYDVYTDRAVKLKNEVSYPEILTLQRPIDGAPIRYQLSAIVEHIGQSPESGHYVCYARRFDGVWMKFDDDAVSKMAEKEHLQKEAYLLLYNQITSLTSDNKE